MSLLIFEKQGWQQPVLQELKGEGGGEEEFRHAREHEKEDVGTPVRTLLFFLRNKRKPITAHFEIWVKTLNF